MTILDPGPGDVRQLWNDGLPVVDIATSLHISEAEVRKHLDAAPEHPAPSSRFVSGGSFILDAPATPPALWGSGGDVLWADGEALMIAGPQGVGKTTVAWQLVKARLGLQPDVLGLPVVPGTRRVLYLAMDRPAQASRAGSRIFTEEHRAVLDDRLRIHKGPPPYDMAANTGIFAALCTDADADTVIVDSLKDAAVGISKDEVGAGYNRARQAAIAQGIQVLELHHTRKEGAGASTTEPKTIDDVYGSVWLTSGVGSVISLHGNPGDPVVSMRHLKQPMNEIGPFTLAHDHTTGRTTIHHATDLVAMVRATGPEGLTVKAAAMTIFDTEKPARGEQEKARRKLERLVADKVLIELPGHRGGVVKASTYHLAADG